MKGLFCFFSLFLLVLPSCTQRNISSRHTKENLHQLSAEIEHSSDFATFISPYSKQISSYSNPLNITSTEAFSYSTKRKKVEKIKGRKILMGDNGSQKNNRSFIKKNYFDQEMHELNAQKYIHVDKNSIFWKIGKVLVTAGLVVLSIFGGVFISVNNGGAGAFFSSGLFIGLAILALSIPFFLLAIITTYMKERSTPIENPNEI